MGIPTRLLAVLDGEKLVRNRRAQDVTLTRRVHGIKGIAALFVKGPAGSPTKGIALKVGVTRRVTAIVVVATGSHQIPATGIMALATTLLIVGVIEVGQTKHMAELMGHSTDTLDRHSAGISLGTIELGRAGIAIDKLAVKSIIGSTQVRSVGPQVTCIVARIT